VDRQFTPYGLSHWVVLLTFAVGATLLVVAGRRHSGPAAARRFGRGLAVVIGVLYLAIRLGSMVPPSLDRSVPLDLSDLVSVAAAYALWTHRHWAFALTYYWGLLLSTQALAFPAHTGPDFPHFGFLAFGFNSIAGTNYGFLDAKPATPSPLDVLGPWPWYLMPVAVLVLGAWTLMTWPWVHSGRRRDTEAGGLHIG
jgi:uncharacterized membrane protein YwaF